MTEQQKQYYKDMQARDRSVLIIRDGHLVSIVTYWIGDDDKKFLTDHEPWTLLEDDPNGETIYIDQFLTYKGRSTSAYIHKEFTKLLQSLSNTYINIKRAKWIRVGAQFRKNNITEGMKNVIQTKSIKP